MHAISTASHAVAYVPPGRVLCAILSTMQDSRDQHGGQKRRSPGALELEPEHLEPGRVIRARREALGLGLRPFERMTAELAARSHLYQRIPFTSMGNLERYDRSTLLRNITPEQLNAIVYILWRGDYQAFARDTGINKPIPLFSQATDPEEAFVPFEVPLLITGERPYQHPAQTPRRARAPAPGCDFVYQHTTLTMAPVINPGQRVGCVYASQPEPGMIAILVRRDGLDAAWYLGNRRYAYEASLNTPFALQPGERVHGIVRFVTPYLSGYESRAP